MLTFGVGKEKVAVGATVADGLAAGLQALINMTRITTSGRYLDFAFIIILIDYGRIDFASYVIIPLTHIGNFNVHTDPCLLKQSVSMAKRQTHYV